MLTVLLSACTFESPRLGTSADTLSGAALSELSLTLRNDGGGTLEWSAETDNPYVTLRRGSRANPAGQNFPSGSLGAGASETLNIVVSGTIANPDVPLGATLLITSNGGNKSIPLSYGATATCGHFGVGSASRGQGPQPVGNEILVAYRQPSGLSPQSLQLHAMQTRTDLSSEQGLRPLSVGDGLLPDVFDAPAEADVDALVAQLAADPRVAYAQRNYYVELQQAPNDAAYDSQWALSGFGLEEAWQVQSGEGGRVVVAIIDSGVDRLHQDLDGRLLEGYDFFKNAPGADPYPVSQGNLFFEKVSHGTHVAGIAAARGNDEYGVAGVAHGPNVVILPIKLFDDCGHQATVDALDKAIRWAAGLPVPGMPTNPDPADVINMSLGVPGHHPVLDAATQAAWDAGSLLVAAAGNHGGTTVNASHAVLSPANAPAVIAVGSVDEDRQRSSFSNYGTGLELMAPGGYGSASSDLRGRCGALTGVGKGPGILSSTVGVPHSCMIGTSMAAPFVTGVAALLISHGEYTTPGEVRDRLQQTALNPNDPEQYGYGLVCADAALGAATQCGAL